MLIAKQDARVLEDTSDRGIELACHLRLRAPHWPQDPATSTVVISCTGRASRGPE